MRNIQNIIKSGKTLEEALIIKDNFQKKYYEKHKKEYIIIHESMKHLLSAYYTRQDEVWDRYVSRWY